MSATYTRWCRFHGEWDDDLDNPSECPKCIELGMTEVQQLRKRIVFLEAALDSPQPGKEQNLYFQLQDAKEELANLKEVFARLRLQREQSYEALWKTWRDERRKLELELKDIRKVK